MEAGELLGTADKTSYASTVRKIYDGRTLESIKALAQKLTARPGTLAILAISDACQIVAARSKDLPGSCNDAVKNAISAFGGKGGGRPDLAQAGGFSPENLNSWMNAVEEYFLAMV
jgi:alanyl-tRNA synthetase